MCADLSSFPIPGSRELIVVHGRGKETNLLPLSPTCCWRDPPFQIPVLTSGGKKERVPKRSALKSEKCFCLPLALKIK